MKTKYKPMPSLSSDADAERFVDTADLSTFKPMHFEFEPKVAELSIEATAKFTRYLKS